MSKVETSTELQNELGQVRIDIQSAIRQGDEQKLIQLRARQDVLPVRILNARIREAEEEIRAFDVDIKKERATQDSLHSELADARSKRTLIEQQLKDAEEVVRDLDCKRLSALHRIESIRKSRQKQLDSIVSLKADIEEKITGARPPSPESVKKPGFTFTHNVVTDKETIAKLEQQLENAEQEVAASNRARDEAKAVVATAEKALEAARPDEEAVAREELSRARSALLRANRDLGCKQSRVESIYHSLAQWRKR